MTDNPQQGPESKCKLFSKQFNALFLSDELDYQMLKAGGARRDRTDDLLNANQALSQLSYGPNRFQGIASGGYPTHHKEWWAWYDSNVRPHPYQGCALTT